MRDYSQKDFEKNVIRNINKNVRDELSWHIGQGNKNACPEFGYPQITFSPPESLQDLENYDENIVTKVDLGPSCKNRKVYLKKQKYINTASNKVYVDSMWEPMANAILSSARKNRELNVAKSIESHENHNVVFDAVMKRFGSSTKLSK